MKLLNGSLLVVALGAVGLANCTGAKFTGNAREGSGPKPDVVGTKPDNPPVDPSGGHTNPNDPTVPSAGGPPPGTTNPNDPNNPGITQNGGDGSEKLFEVTCDTGEDGSRPVIDFAQAKDIKVNARIKGEFCPKAQRNLTVMFVVDWSGSMGHHRRSDGVDNPGHDPQGGGTCGRLEAARQVVANIKGQQKPTDHVSIGFVPFAGGTLPRRTVSPMPLAQFEAMLTPAVFCSYVVQDSSFGYDPQNPGGLNGAAEGMVGVEAGYSATNYKAAIDVTSGLLKGIGGRKVVYFVSDGEPTAGGRNPAQGGIDASQRMRTAVDNLTFNALLLGFDDPNAESILQQVAGSPDRVRRAAQAQDLASQILQFPDSSAIDEASGQARVRVAPFPGTDLGLKSLKKDTARDAIWVFETQPFILLGVVGLPVVNEVTVTAKGTDGSTHQSIISIRYTKQ